MNTRREELERLIAIENFAEYPNKDYIEKLKDELDSLPPDTGEYYVEFINKSSNMSKLPSYLTGDPDLCFSNKPTYFDSEEEAKKYLNNARTGNLSSYIVRILKRCY